MSDEDPEFVPSAGSGIGSRVIGYVFLTLVSFSAVGFIAIIAQHHLSSLGEATGIRGYFEAIAPAIPFFIIGLLVFVSIRQRRRPDA